MRVLWNMISRPLNRYNTQLLLVLVSMLVAVIVGIWLAPNENAGLYLTGAALVPLVAVSGAFAIKSTRSLFTNISFNQIAIMAMAFVPLVWVQRSYQSAISGQLTVWDIIRIGVMGLLGLVILFLPITHQANIWEALLGGLYIPIVLFSSWNLMTVAWSVYPAWSLYRSVEYFIAVVVFAVIAYSIKELREFASILNWVWFLNLLLLISVLISAVVAPSRAILRSYGVVGYGLEGVFPSIPVNGVGHISSILMLVALVRMLTRRGNSSMYAMAFLLSFPMLFISQTRSAILGAVVAGTFAVLGSRRYWQSGLLALLALIALLNMPTTISEEALDYMARGQNDAQIANLSGRADYWTLAFDYLEERPLTGYGAYAGGRFLVGHVFDENLGSTHSTYVDVLLDTGYVGSALFALVLLAPLVALLRQLVQCMRHEKDYSLLWSMTLEALTVLVFLIIRAYFSAGGLARFPAIEFLAIYSFAAYIRRNRYALNMHLASR